MNAELPAFDSVHTALAFHLASTVLTVACWSGYFYLYDVEERQLVEYTTANCNRIPKNQLKGRPRLTGVAFNPASPDNMTLFSSSFICSVDMSKPASEEAKAGEEKKRKRDKQSKMATLSQENFKIVDRYRPILHLDFLDSNSMVVVERPWLQVMESFPGVLHRPRYGT